MFNQIHGALHVPRRGALSAALLVLSLGGCATPPDLGRIEASFAPAPQAWPVRVSSEVARSDFGRQVSDAVQTHPDLAASGAVVRAAQARAEAERRGFLPRFAAGAVLGSVVDGTLSGNGLSPVLRVMQLVYDGGVSASRETAAQARVFQTRGAQLELAAARTMDSVAAWHDLRAAVARARIAGESVRAHERALAQVRERADAGAGGESDVMTTQARLASARARAAEATARVERAQAGFAASFGAPPPANLGAPPAAPQLPDVPDAVLIMTSPRFLAIEARLAAADADVAAVRAQRFPRVSIDGRAQRGRTQATLDIDYDPGAPGSQRARIAAAEAERDAIEAERQGLARNIARALADLRSDERAGAARVGAARAAVQAHRATVEASREEFSIGRRSLIGLLDAERDLFDASEALIAAELELSLSGYAALALTGDILDAFAIRLPNHSPIPTAPAEAPAGVLP